MNEDIEIDEVLGGFEEDAKEEAAQPAGPEVVDFVARYVEPHKKVSREVMAEDMTRVLEEAHVLYNLCFLQVGLHSGALALYHCQIDDKDPLQFFVTYEKEVIINPKIINHTQSTVDSIEGCMSMPGLLPIKVQRWNKCESRYHVLTEDGRISEPMTENLTGKRAKVWQHECQHMGLLGDKYYIYDI